MPDRAQLLTVFHSEYAKTTVGMDIAYEKYIHQQFQNMVINWFIVDEAIVPSMSNICPEEEDA
jgi:hypothetical protein